MKKLKLSEFGLSDAEVLTKEQMKNVLGGKQAQIGCSVFAYDAGGNVITMLSGLCSDNSLNSCRQDASNTCNTFAEEYGGGAYCSSSSCFYV